jgi:hypothetical protein
VSTPSFAGLTSIIPERTARAHLPEGLRGFEAVALRQRDPPAFDLLRPGSTTGRSPKAATAFPSSQRSLSTVTRSTS